MSARLSLKGVGLLALAGAALVAPACMKEPKLCTPASAGLGDQRTVVRRELPGLATKSDCSPHVEILRSADDLRAAYQRLGVAIIGDGGPTSSGAVELPSVDFTTETVVLREETDLHPVSWMVTEGDLVTIGSQGCATGAEVCSVAVLAIDARVTKAEAYSCEALGCTAGSDAISGGGQ
ncbi:hypothetical protein BH11MYX4_BH11MYX4_22430 [soil metagenome]